MQPLASASFSPTQVPLTSDVLKLIQVLLYNTLCTNYRECQNWPAQKHVGYKHVDSEPGHHYMLRTMPAYGN
jgi:hypothetical protein